MKNAQLQKTVFRSNKVCFLNRTLHFCWCPFTLFPALLQLKKHCQLEFNFKHSKMTTKHPLQWRRAKILRKRWNTAGDWQPLVIGQIKRSHRVITAVGHFIQKMDTDELASEGERERDCLTARECLVSVLPCRSFPLLSLRGTATTTWPTSSTQQ